MDNNFRLSTRPAKRAACDRCHVLKSRCSRSAGKHETCDRCRRLGIECVSSAPLRTGRPRGSGLGMALASATSDGKQTSNVAISRKPSINASHNDRSNSKPTRSDDRSRVSRNEKSRGRDSYTNNPISYETFPIAAFANDNINFVGSDFSGSSLEGNNNMDLNSFTPMTTSSEELMQDSSSLAFHDQPWHNLSAGVSVFDDGIAYGSNRPQMNGEIAADAAQTPSATGLHDYLLTKGSTGQAYWSGNANSGFVVPQPVHYVQRTRLQQHLLTLEEQIRRLQSMFRQLAPHETFICFDEIAILASNFIDVLLSLSNTSQLKMEDAASGNARSINPHTGNFEPDFSSTSFPSFAASRVSSPDHQVPKIDNSTSTQILNIYMHLIRLYHPLVGTIYQQSFPAHGRPLPLFQLDDGLQQHNMRVPSPNPEEPRRSLLDIDDRSSVATNQQVRLISDHMHKLSSLIRLNIPNFASHIMSGMQDAQNNEVGLLTGMDGYEFGTLHSLRSLPMEEQSLLSQLHHRGYDASPMLS